MVRPVRCVRHGEAAHNVVIAAGRAADDAATIQQGRAMLDPPLTALGQSQAEALRAELAAAPADVIVTSPLRRALETTALINGSARVVVTALHTENGIAVAGDDVAGRPCQRGARSVTELQAAYPVYDFAALEPWTTDDAAGYFHPLCVDERLALFREFVETLDGSDIVVVGHSGFFLRLMGASRKMRNCELVACDI